MRSIPKRTLDDNQPLTPIKGNPPSLIDLPDGCAFSERCPYARERCFDWIPGMVELEEGHSCSCFFAQDGDFQQNSPIYDTEASAAPPRPSFRRRPESIVSDSERSAESEHSERHAPTEGVSDER
jgi:oligopeptide/dipeptide ABC transporter ATP-binding protein